MSSKHLAILMLVFMLAVPTMIGIMFIPDQAHAPMREDGGASPSPVPVSPGDTAAASELTHGPTAVPEGSLKRIVYVNDTALPSMGTRGTSLHTIMSQGFEGTSLGSGWRSWDQRTSNPWKNDTWNVSTTHHRGGSGSANCSAAGKVAADYPTGRGVGYDNDMDSWLTYGPFDLRGCKNATFTFYYWTDLESGDEFDYGVSRNNSLYYVQSGLDQSSDPWQTTSSWNYVDYPLIWMTNFDHLGNCLLGDTSVWIAFLHRSNATLCGDKGYNGSFVDDVTIRVETSTPTAPTMFKVDGVDTGASLRRIYKDRPSFLWQFNDPDKSPYSDYQSEFCLELDNETNWFDSPKLKLNSTSQPSVNGGLSSVQYPATASPLSDGETYYMRVKCRDGRGNWGPWGYSSFYSGEFNFTTNDDPSPPVLRTFNTSGILVSGSETHYINWTISENVNDTDPDDTILINIYYSDDGGSTWTSISSDEANDGNYLWTVPTTVESGDCLVNVSANDGYEVVWSHSHGFTIDNLAPVITGINVTSTSGYVHTESMSPAGGMVWYNSLPGMGASQVISISVNWTDANPVSATGSTAFGGQSPTVPGSGPSVLQYTLAPMDSVNYTVTVNVTDGAGRYDLALVRFNVDNNGPVAVGSMICHGDSFVDPSPIDNDTHFFVTWGISADAGVGLAGYMVDLVAPPVNMTTLDRTEFNTTRVNGNTTVYLRPVDLLGNTGPLTSANITVDTVEPGAPVVVSPTHPTGDIYYSEWSPVFLWSAPVDLTGVSGYSWMMDQSSDTEPDEIVDSTDGFASFSGLLPGSYWFHVRARDGVHWWGPTTHYPFMVDNRSADCTDLSDTDADTGGSAVIRFLASDADAGLDIDACHLYWRFSDRMAFRIADLERSGDNFSFSVDIPQDSDADIQYYAFFNDSATDPNVRRCPAAGYSTITVHDIAPPVVGEVSGDLTVLTGAFVNITLTASDNILLGGAIYVDDDSGAREQMERVVGSRGDSGIFYHVLTAPLDSLTPIHYHLEVSDASDNIALSPLSGSYVLTITDGETPWATDITGDTAGAPGGRIGISCIPYDNIDNVTQLTGTIFVGEPVVPVPMSPEGIKLVGYVNIPHVSADLSYYILLEDRDNNSMRYPPSTAKYLVSVPTLTHPLPSSTVGGMVNVTYPITGLPGMQTTITLEYRHEATSLWTPIVTDVPNLGYTLWDTTGVNDGRTVLRLSVTFASFSRTIDVVLESDWFSVSNPLAPSLSVTTPLKGVSYSGTMTVVFESMDPNDDAISVSVYYSNYDPTGTLDTRTWSQLVTGLPASGTTLWDTLTVPDGEYLLKVTASEVKVQGLSNITVVGPFSISNDLIMKLDVTNDTGRLPTSTATLSWSIQRSINSAPFVPDPSVALTMEIYLRYGTGPWVFVGNSTEFITSYNIDMSGREEGIYSFRVVLTLSNGREASAVSGPVEYAPASSSTSSTSGTLVLVVIVIVALVLLIAGIVVFVLIRRRPAPDDDDIPPETLPQFPQEELPAGTGEEGMVDDGLTFEVPAPPGVDAPGETEASTPGGGFEEPPGEMELPDLAGVPAPAPLTPVRPVRAPASGQPQQLPPGGTAPVPDRPALPPSPATAEDADADIRATLDDLFADI